MSVEAADKEEGTGVDQEAVRRKALAQGWSDKEHWRGKPEEWVDAETFVKRGDEWLAGLKRSNDTLSRDLTATKAQLKELREATEDFKKFQKDAYDRKVADLESKMEALKQERAQAISDGDGKKVNELDDALDTAKDGIREAKEAAKEAAKPAKVTAPEPQALDPVMQNWLEENDWFGKDKRMTAIANGIGESLRIEFPDLKGKEFLDKMNEVLAEEFPARFAKKGPRSPVESGAGGRGGRSGSTNTRTYENLPADAQAACDRYVKQKLMTREQYLQDYAW